MALEGRLAPRVRAAALDRFVAGDLAGLDRLFAGMPPPLDRVRVERVVNARVAAAAPVWRVAEDGACRFRFHPAAWDLHPAEIGGRWLDIMPLVAAVLAAGPVGSVGLNLGDEPHRPGLAFDAGPGGHTLVPDPFFLATDNHAALAAGFAARARPWTARAPVLFWRGTTTGAADCLDDLPRVRLCRAALALGDRADVGLSAATQDFADAGPRLRAAGLMRPFVAPDRLDAYRYHLDIDGNGCSWGLLAKLRTGSPVLRIVSTSGRRQWWHDRLVPWETHAPVRADLADLGAVLDRLVADPALAGRIGAAGSALAGGLTVADEVARAVPTVVAAFGPWPPA